MSSYWLGKKKGKTRQYIKNKIKMIIRCSDNYHYDPTYHSHLFIPPENITQFESLLKLMDNGSYYHSNRRLYIDICNKVGMEKYVDEVICERNKKIRIILKDFVISDLINIIIECFQ